jgi:acyl-CoA thioester hydrolase
MAGDLLVVKSRILEVRDKTLRFIHTMYNVETGGEVATSELVAAHLDRKLRKACSFPEEIKKNCLTLVDQTTS